MLLGLFGSPVILYLVGTLIADIKGSKARKTEQMMREDHNKKVKKMQKEYNSLSKQLNRKVNKIRKVVEKAKKGQEKKMEASG